MTQNGNRNARNTARVAGVGIRIATDPDGRLCVLLQVLGHNEWFLGLRPDDARAVATTLAATADDLDAILAREP